MSSETEIRPFRVDMPDEAITDLRRYSGQVPPPVHTICVGIGHGCLPTRQGRAAKSADRGGHSRTGSQDPAWPGRPSTTGRTGPGAAAAAGVRGGGAVVRGYDPESCIVRGFAPLPSQEVM
jgi:hypothetical protein